MSTNQKIRPEWVPLAYRDSGENILKKNTDDGSSEVKSIVRRNFSKKLVRVKNR